MSMAKPEIPPELVKFLRAAGRVAVLTGAGISAESGIPTFREAQTGVWARFRPEDLASPAAFERNPADVWEWYRGRREQVLTVEPNAGHYALAEMERKVIEFRLITQNIDGLHRRAGSRQIIELHGNILRSKCQLNGHAATDWDEGEQVPPLCAVCGSMLRPDVVWFGEMLPGDALEQAWRAAENCHVFFSIGTSALVNPAAMMPLLAKRRGAVLVEVNIEETPLTDEVDFFLRGPAGVVLPEMVHAVWGWAGW